MRKAVTVLVLLLATSITLHAATSDIDQRLRAIAAKSDGVVGVAALDVESAWRYDLRSNEPFPMGSVFKFPLAIEVMHQVEQGKLKLEQTYTLGVHDFSPGYSPLAERAGGKRLTITLQRLLEFSLGESDNSAADYLLRLVGGPAAVTKRMRTLGVEGVRVDRSEGEMALDLWKVKKRKPQNLWTLEMFRRLRAASTAEERATGAAEYARDPRDTATPAGMLQLLQKLDRHAVGLSEAGTRRLIAIMEKSPTGQKRVRAVLPTGARWAHKTGTMPGTTNDAGIVTLPNEKRIIVVVFVKGGKDSGDAAREKVIADIARVVLESR